jgi:hypothetical protein
VARALGPALLTGLDWVRKAGRNLVHEGKTVISEGINRDNHLSSLKKMKTIDS